MMPLSIYIHIPFCVTKCGYCDFLSFCGRLEAHEPYAEAIIADIAACAKDFTGHEVVTVFFGGGTPTVLAAGQLGRILGTIMDNYTLADDASITTEANPDTIDDAYLTVLRHAGFNRISFGVQSFNDDLLAKIGRIHNAEKAVRAVHLAARAGFDDINIDLMFALPHQSISDFEQSVDVAVKLPVTHISCYALSAEDGTPLATNKDLLRAMPDDTADRAMYHLAAQKLSAHGFEHYEISNWGRPGRHCNHNIGYWTRREYIGFGLGAHSLVQDRRFCRTTNLEDYIKGNFFPIHLEDITHQAAMAEFVILGLRLVRGIDVNNFRQCFGQNIEHVFGHQLEKFVKNGLLAIDSPNIKLTKHGRDLSNAVFADFI
ncbi:MAG: radical SAM family heme chaperone HemW [Defluviitaleaceae bacterium]|nr:radical SAM family heme chaperone HemW [Defluviitaleaceae bacterium]